MKEPLYLSKESSTPEKKLFYAKGTASSAVHPWTPQERATTGYYSLYSGHHELQNQVSQLYGLTTSYPQSPAISDESEEIVIVPLRELPREYAKMEISEYIQQAGGRKVYISELAEKLRLDIELIMEIMEELEAETQK